MKKKKEETNKNRKKHESELPFRIPSDSFEFRHVVHIRRSAFASVNVPRLCEFNFCVTKEWQRATRGSERARRGKRSRKTHSRKLDGLLSPRPLE